MKKYVVCILFYGGYRNQFISLIIFNRIYIYARKIDRSDMKSKRQSKLCIHTTYRKNNNLVKYAGMGLK